MELWVLGKLELHLKINTEFSYDNETLNYPNTLGEGTFIGKHLFTQTRQKEIN